MGLQAKLRPDRDNKASLRVHVRLGLEHFEEKSNSRLWMGLPSSHLLSQIPPGPELKNIHVNIVLNKDSSAIVSVVFVIQC